MRTKSIILAGAALATGLLSASAANVYSLNVVGYVNTVIKGGGAYTLMANPLNAPTNDMVHLLPLSTLPNKSQVLIWNGSGYTPASKIAGSWGANNFTLSPGTGFFVKNGVAGSPDITNTFVGEVLGGIPGTNSVQVLPGYNMIGSPTPIAGNLFAQGDGTLNMGALLFSLPNKSQVLTWDNSGSGGFVPVSKIAGAWGGGSNVLINVAQGFFVNSKAATTNTWTVVVTNTP